VHLAYLDDSDTKAKNSKWQVMSAVIIKDNDFKLAELGMAAIPEQLMGAEKLSKFEEFHACELYGGYGAFEGIDQDRRFEAIRKLLALLQTTQSCVVYGSIDLDVLKNEVYGSADPVDVCFRKCLVMIRDWADALVKSHIDAEMGDGIWEFDRVAEIMMPRMVSNLVILVVDECDGKTKNTLQKSFHSLRQRNFGFHLLSDCFHDDMYFGDSRYSIGIQLADLCSYFIARHLQGDTEIDGFYEMIEPRIYRRDEALSEAAK
jgi:hypothetical protein